MALAILALYVVNLGKNINLSFDTIDYHKYLNLTVFLKVSINVDVNVLYYIYRNIIKYRETYLNLITLSQFFYST